MKFSGMMCAGILYFACAAHAGNLPRTLFEIGGAKQEAAKLSNSVLVIIDEQREYVDGALPLAGVEAAIKETAQLLARARKSGTPVIHIVHKGGGVLFNPDGKYFAIVAPVHPQAGEPVIEKMRISAFAGTNLEEVLRSTGRKHLLLSGFMTHNCVSSTARAAFDLGYAVTIVANTTATRDLPDGRGGMIPAAELQAASLAALGDRTAVVVQGGDEVPD